jgi:Fic family protein
LTNARDNNDLSGWLKFFLKGVIETAQNGVNTFSLLMKLQQDDETLIKNNMGSRSANALNVVNQLYKDPIITASSVSKLLDITPASSYSLLASLLEIGIIEEITGAKRGRIYAHSKYIRIFSQN